MKKILKIAAIVLLVAFIAIQFVPNDLPENKADFKNDLIQLEEPTNEVKMILKKACYDCHSNQTIYPWYSYIAPVSWLVGADVRVGRDELNFSDWGEQSKRRKIKIMNEVAEEIEKKSMPLKVYTITHRDAVLSDEEINAITSWTTSVTDEILGD